LERPVARLAGCISCSEPRRVVSHSRLFNASDMGEQLKQEKVPAATATH
jgi:hypothetical protein